MIRTTLTALALVGACSAAQAQVAAQDVIVQVSVGNASTQIFINRSTSVPTFQIAANGVDIIETGVFEDFTLCVQGTTAGGYKLQTPGYSSAIGGQALGGISTGANPVVASIQVESSPGNSSFRTLTTSASSTTRAYGISCAFAAEPNTYGSRLLFTAPNGTVAIAPDTYAGVLSLQVVPQ